MPGSPFSSLFQSFAELLDRRIGWDRLPLPLAMLTLIGLRNRLREENLYDTGRGALDRPDVAAHERYLTARTLDGTFNDLNDPLMGSLGSRFGRNVPLELHVRGAAGRAARPEPAPGQPRAADARRVPARRRRSTCSPARGSSSRCTTGSATARTSRGSVADHARRGRPVAGAPDDDPAHAARPERRPGRARRRSSPTTPTGGTARRSTGATSRSPSAPLGRGRQAADRRDGPPACRSRGARRPHGRRRQLLGRPRAAPLAVHARAQRDLRPPARAAHPAPTTSSSTRRGSSTRR